MNHGKLDSDAEILGLIQAGVIHFDASARQYYPPDAFQIGE
jgi:hypothetical protein